MFPPVKDWKVEINSSAGSLQFSMIKVLQRQWNWGSYGSPGPEEQRKKH